MEAGFAGIRVGDGQRAAGGQVALAVDVEVLGHCARRVAADHGYVAYAVDGHGNGVCGAIDGLDGKGLDLCFTGLQVLHRAVRHAVGPGAVGGDGQGAEGAGRRCDGAMEAGFAGIRVGDGQRAAGGQVALAVDVEILGHCARRLAADHGCVAYAVDGHGDGLLGAIHGADGKGLDPGFTGLQILHSAVRHAIGPGAVGGDGQSAEGAGRRCDGAMEAGFAGIRVGDGQRAAGGQVALAVDVEILGHCARRLAADHGCVAYAVDGHGDGLLGAIHGADGKGLDPGFTGLQILHSAVRHAIGPGAVGGDGQSAEGAGRRCDGAMEAGFAGIRVGDGQRAAGGQVALAVDVEVLGHCARRVAADHGYVAYAVDGHGNGVCGAIDGLDGKGLDLCFTGLQVLHRAVRHAVGPGAVGGDGQSAQCSGRSADGGLEAGFAGIRVGNGQRAAGGQVARCDV